MLKLIAIAPEYSGSVVINAEGEYFYVASSHYYTIPPEKLDRELFERLDHGHLIEPEGPHVFESIATVQQFIASSQSRTRAIPPVRT